MQDIICLNENYSTTRLLYKFVDSEYLDKDGKIKEKSKFNINNSTLIGSSEDKFDTILFLPEDEGGLRTKGYFKKSYEGKPLISIITVVYNGKQYIEETIQNVINQTYSNVEYIIIDGASTDGTLDIIKKYEDKIDYWVSGRDKGIYYAMNKGIDLATGDWINFMNAGDMFFEKNVIENIFNDIHDNNVKVIYGNHVTVYEEYTVLEKAGKINNLLKGPQFSHQSTFFQSEYHKQHKYDTTFSLGADFCNILSIYYLNDKKCFKYLPISIARINPYGITQMNILQDLSQRWNIVKKFKKDTFFINIYYIFLIFKHYIKINFFSDSFISNFRRFKKNILLKKIF